MKNTDTALNHRQLADFFAGGFAFPHELVYVEPGDTREIRVRYRGITLTREEFQSSGNYWVPSNVNTEVLGDSLPTLVLPDDFMPLTDLLSVVETIRDLDTVIQWVHDEEAS